MAKMNYLKRIGIWISTINSFLKSFKGCKSKIMDSEKTVEYVLNNRKSIIRFGDGEFNIINGKSINYQKCTPKLAKEMNEILQTYFNLKERCNYILCVPKYFMECSGFELMRKREYISSWSYSRKIFQQRFPQKILYGDAFLFKKGNEKIYERLWKNQGYKTCIFVHNDKKYSEKFEEMYNINTKFIKISSKNAYDQIEDIENQILKYIYKYTNQKDVIILVSAGPAGKILVSNLAQKGFIAIDTGHCWDNPLIIRN